MKYLKSKDVTEEHIKEVNYHFERPEGEKVLLNYGYAFYYNQLFINNLSIFDADRYANLNTIIGYEVDIDTFINIEKFLWERCDFDLMELNGSREDKEMVLHAAAVLQTPLFHEDFSKWRNLEKEESCELPHAVKACGFC